MAEVFLPYTQGQMAGQQVALGQLNQLQGVLGMQQKMQEMQDQQMLRGVLAQTGGDLEKAIPALIQAGRPEAAAKLGVLGHQMAQMKQQTETMRRQEEFRTRLPGLLQQYGPQQGSPEIAAPPDEIGGGPGRAAMPGKPADYSGLGLAVAQYDPNLGLGFVQKAEDRQARIDTANEGRQQRLFEINMRLQDRALDRQQREALAREGMELRREMQQAQIANSQALRAIAASNRQNPIIQTTSGIYERTPQGLVQLMDPNTGQPVRPMSMTGGNYEEKISQNFEKNPVVKSYMELAPEVQVVDNYMKSRPQSSNAQRAVNDKNLVNTFLRVTHPKGDQISNFERKDLAGLPALGPRLQQAIEGFFSGRYVPDEVATEMHRIINEKFDAKGQQVKALEDKAISDLTRQGASPEAVRRVAKPRTGSGGGNRPSLDEIFK